MATAAIPLALTDTTTPGGTLASGDPNRPDRRSEAYERMLRRSEKCRALIAGLEAIRDGGEDFLPRYFQEDDDSYEERRDLAALSPTYARTILACVGLLLQQPPSLGDDMPQELKDFAEDVDRAGMHLNVFTWFLIFWALVDGRVGVLVDYPRVRAPAGVDAEEEAKLGLRPYFVLVESPDIYLPLYEKINGVKTLTLLILREKIQRRVGRFGVAEITRFRIYSRESTKAPNNPRREISFKITAEAWETQGGDPAGVLYEVEKPTEMKNVSRIPFSLLVAGQELKNGEVKPTLLDLAELNIEHHQMKTDIRHLTSLACVPTLVRKGFKPPKDDEGEDIEVPVILGPRRVQDVPAEGDLLWIAPEVSVLAPAMQQLKDNEAQQGAAGLAFLSPDHRQAETAEAKRIDTTAQNANLSTIGTRAGDTLEEAFGFAADFLRSNRAKKGSVSLHTDFEETVMSADVMNAFAALAEKGKLSIETLLEILEKGRRLPEGFDKAAELKRILLEARQQIDQENQALERTNAGANDDDAKDPSDSGPTPAARPRRVTVRNATGAVVSTLESEP